MDANNTFDNKAGTRRRARALLAALLATVCATSAVGQDAADTLAKYRGVFETAVQKQEAKFSGQLGELDKKLAEAVKTLETRYTQQANLEGVIAAREVLEALDDPFTEVETPEHANIDDLKKLLNQYFQKKRDMEAESSKALETLRASYAASLENEKKKLTNAGKIEEALAIHNEIKNMSGTPAPTPAAQPAPPRPTTAQPQPAQPNTARQLYSEAEVIEKLKALAGSTILFTGRVKALENDGSNRGNFFIVFEGGVKIRLTVPNNTELATRGNAVLLKVKDPPKPRYTSRYSTPPPPGEDILLPGMRLAVQTTIAAGGVLNHATPNCYLNPLVVGSDNAVVRRRLNALCGAPCPAVQRATGHPCPVCGANEQITTPPATGGTTTIYYY